MAGFASRRNPRPEPGRFDLGRHLFGGARRAVVLVRVGFGLRGGGAADRGEGRASSYVDEAPGGAQRDLGLRGEARGRAFVTANE